ncbi:MAG: DUF1573 domain-containing protein [Bacteroidales bacterium]|nr:DUF1573 domain-containing protein [Bacteroidales bacterium]
MKKNLCFFVLALIATLSMNAQQTVNLVGAPETKTLFTPSVEGPEVQFERLVHDFGEIVENTNGDVDFKFKNIGSEPLVLITVQPSCGTCVSIRSWTREPIMPGQEGVVAVRYNTHILGPMGKTVTVSSNGKTERVVLRLNGTVVAK